MEQIELLKLRIEYDEDVFGSYIDYERILNSLLISAENIALSQLYPFKDWSDLKLPRKYNDWQLRAAEELYNLTGTNGIKSYSENGLSWSRATDGLSVSLLEELTSKAAAPIRKDKNNE